MKLRKPKTHETCHKHEKIFVFAFTGTTEVLCLKVVTVVK